MTDFLGNELNIGDDVVFIYSSMTGGKRLMKGSIIEFKNGSAVIDGMRYAVYDNDPAAEKPSSWSHFYDDRVKVKPTSIYKIIK